MAHELVVVVELVGLDADYRTVVADSDQEVTTVSIEERGYGLQRCMRHELVVASILVEAPAQGRLELQRLRFAALDQLLGVPVAAQVMVEQEVLQSLSEGSIVRDPLVELEIGIDDLLDHVLDLLVEGQPHILPRVGPSG